MAAFEDPMIRTSLVVVAHPDDEILGFGGAGAKRAADGEIVQAAILCGSANKRTLRPSDQELLEDTQSANHTAGFQAPVLGAFPNLALNTVSHVAMVEFIEDCIRRFRPSQIFTHHPGDLNDDHVCVARACMAATRLFQRTPGLPPVEGLFFMEIPSATDWAFPGPSRSFEPNTFIGIQGFLDRKIEALGCYRRVMRPYPHPRSEEVLRGLAAIRGSQCGLNHAEAFQCIFQAVG